MNPPLKAHELALLHQVFQRYPEIIEVKIFGSRAKGTHRPNSDVDLALWGVIDEKISARIAAELEKLPLPYRFDVTVQRDKAALLKVTH